MRAPIDPVRVGVKSLDPTEPRQLRARDIAELEYWGKRKEERERVGVLDWGKRSMRDEGKSRQNQRKRKGGEMVGDTGTQRDMLVW